MDAYLLAFLMGVVAGLRSMTPPAAVAWAATLGRLHLEQTWLAWLGHSLTAYIATVLALCEWIADKLPKTPSRKKPGPFIWRILVGALCGAALSAPAGLIPGALLGAIGAVAGTLGGFEFRARLVRAIGGRDLPIALLEDAIAIGTACFVVTQR